MKTSGTEWKIQNESTQLSSPDFSQRRQKHDGEKTASSTNVARKTGYLHAKN
jgi:hypothetical protein